MPLSPNFSTSESLSVLSNVTFIDTSTGSDNTLTERRIYIRLANGNWLTTSGESSTEAYETWNISNQSITLSLLGQSTTASVTVKWMTGSTPTYILTKLQEWDLYDYIFAFGLIQNQTAAPGIIQDTTYYSNFMKFITNIWGSEAAVDYGNDLYSSQSLLNANQNMINNSTFYF